MATQETKKITKEQAKKLAALKNKQLVEQQIVKK